ncbi:hypothetical protein [Kibdelosporangium philippinense]
MSTWKFRPNAASRVPKWVFRCVGKVDTHFSNGGHGVLERWTRLGDGVG